jgi:RES domain-containing protein
VSRSVWRIATDTKDYEADDLSGAGAKMTGGRWNEPGIPMIYAAESRALACLETMVHLNAGGLPLNRYLVEIEVPDGIWSAAEKETAATLRVGWDAAPAGRASIGFGSGWARSKRSLLLLVPSAIVPEESNILINPEHPHRPDLRARKIRKWLYDPRLARSAA